ncbi:unnamed protein product, partial [Heterotrigona itama]
MVFNVTQYMDFHPGGVDELMRGVGKDATKLFESVHAWVNYQSILQKCVVGRLSRGSVSGSSSSPTENTVSNTADCSSATLNPITSCTTRSQENASDGGLSSIKMDWKQTVPTITFYYKMLRNCPGVSYEVAKRSDTKVAFKLIFENDILTHDLDLIGEVEWPPVCARNLETMQVEFTFTKRDKMPWMNFGEQVMCRHINDNIQSYREYKVVANEPLSKNVYMLILQSKEFVQILPLGRHVIAKLNNL